MGRTFESCRVRFPFPGLDLLDISDPYTSFFLFFVVCAGFVITMLLLASFLGPKNRNSTKQLPFECGAVSVGSVRSQRFNVRFYLVAVLFILFDVEIIFMYPWAVVLEDLGWFAFLQMMVFVFLLAVAFVYEWKKGVLQWNAPR